MQISAELKHVRDWGQVTDKWKKTVSYRRQQLQGADYSLQQILKDWPLFKYSRAPELVCIKLHYKYFKNVK